MPSPRTLALLQSLRGNNPLSPVQRAQDLIIAIDAGGLPLIPARVNDIARQLGLEVTADAQISETIEPIRLALIADDKMRQRNEPLQGEGKCKDRGDRINLFDNSQTLVPIAGT